MTVDIKNLNRITAAGYNNFHRLDQTETGTFYLNNVKKIIEGKRFDLMKVGIRKITRYRRKNTREIITKKLRLQTGKTDVPRNKRSNKEYQEIYSICKKTNVIYTSKSLENAIKQYYKNNEIYKPSEEQIEYLRNRAKRISVFFNLIN